MTSKKPRRVGIAGAATVAAPAAVHNHDRDYSALLTAVQTTFARSAITCEPVFQTDAEGLFDAYLDGLPSDRQVHNCNACRRFIETYGGLVRITPKGDLDPIMWDPGDAPLFYMNAFEEMRRRVASAKVVSPFYTREKVWGTPVTGPWTHLSVVPTPMLVMGRGILSPYQKMAAAKENFRTVSTALREFSPAALDQAIRILDADALSRSEKFIGPVKWLRELHDRPKWHPGVNLLWRAVAMAPEGYCHPRASVVGSLLEDIAAGLPFDDIKRRFNAKLHPLAYQRPQAAPAAGNIAAAEKIVERLGIERSLERRFARLDDFRAMLPKAITWEPAGEKPATGTGVFGHLKPKAAAPSVKPVNLPPRTMSWVVFRRDVLKAADRIQMLAPEIGPYLGLTTAVHADAPPILKWDREDARNPFAWYVYANGSRADAWGLTARHWVDVAAVIPLPTLLGAKPMPSMGEGAVLVLKGAVDGGTPGSCLFPEILRDELREVRATIEAHSRRDRLQGKAEADACGYDLRKGSASCRLKVWVGGSPTEISIDRWG